MFRDGVAWLGLVLAGIALANAILVALDHKLGWWVPTYRTRERPREDRG